MREDKFKAELNSLMNFYSKSLITGKNKEQALLNLTSFIEGHSVLVKKLNDILDIVCIKYGIKLMSIKCLANTFEVSEYYTALHYDVYGSDMAKYLESIGRQVLYYKGYPFDCIEVCNRVQMPYNLYLELDSHLQYVCLNHYLAGIMGNPDLSNKVGSIHRLYCNKKNTDKFNDFVEKIRKTFNEEPARKTRFRNYVTK
jgi:hypothetical protein